jgi:hypothetical protein
MENREFVKINYFAFDGSGKSFTVATCSDRLSLIHPARNTAANDLLKQSRFPRSFSKHFHRGQKVPSERSKRRRGELSDSFCASCNVGEAKAGQTARESKKFFHKGVEKIKENARDCSSSIGSDVSPES